MKTVIPTEITTRDEAEEFLTALYKNGESYHPEDDAHDIIWACVPAPTEKEKDKLNRAMAQIHKIPEFDPCGHLCDLTMTDNYRDYLQLVIDSHHGVYGPKLFVDQYGQYLNLTDEEKEDMKSPENEHYWETWSNIEERIFNTEKEDYRILSTNGDIYIYPAELILPEEAYD